MTSHGVQVEQNFGDDDASVQQNHDVQSDLHRVALQKPHRLRTTPSTHRVKGLFTCLLRVAALCVAVLGGGRHPLWEGALLGVHGHAQTCRYGRHTRHTQRYLQEGSNDATDGCQ